MGSLPKYKMVIIVYPHLTMKITLNIISKNGLETVMQFVNIILLSFPCSIETRYSSLLSVSRIWKVLTYHGIFTFAVPST